MADLIFLAGGGRDLTESAIIPSVTVEVEHTMENTISKYPIEKSPDGAYNAVVKNNEVTVRGAFSNIHLPSVLFENSTPDIIGDVAIGDATAEEGGTQPAVTGVDRTLEAFKLIKDARDTLKYLDIVTGYTTYKECLIQSFSVTENKETGNLMSFVLVFVQPRFTEVTNAVSANLVDQTATNQKQSVQEKKDQSEIEDECKGRTLSDSAGFDVPLIGGASTEGACRVVNTAAKALVPTDPSILGN